MGPCTPRYILSSQGETLSRKQSADSEIHKKHTRPPSPTILLMTNLNARKIITTSHLASLSPHIDQSLNLSLHIPLEDIFQLSDVNGKMQFSLIFYNLKLKLHFT